MGEGIKQESREERRGNRLHTEWSINMPPTRPRIRPPTHPPTQSLIRSFNHPLTHPPTHSLTYTPTHSHKHLLTYTPTHTNTHSLTSIGGSGLLAMSSASYRARMNGSASCSKRSAANPSCLTCKCFLRKSKPYREECEKGRGVRRSVKRGSV